MCIIDNVARQELSNTREWRNWQTRTFEGRVVIRTGSSPVSRTRKSPSRKTWTFSTKSTCKNIFCSKRQQIKRFHLFIRKVLSIQSNSLYKKARQNNSKKHRPKSLCFKNAHFMRLLKTWVCYTSYVQ